MDEKLSSDESVMKKLKNKKNYTSGYLGNKTTPASSSFIPLLISFLYSSLMTFLNSFIVVVIHDRTPNKDKHPPLPDVLLDNISFRSWSFKASEATVIAFVVAFATLLAFHRHRLVILRRFFIIYGTVILFRCPCLYVTSLPVSSPHLLCDPQLDDNVWSKLQRAWGVYSKFGMSSRGVNTCGDYMFSGHAAALTLTNLFINQYTPLRLLHLLSWAVCLAGMFLIIAGHAHYTFDIVVAFIVSFLYHYYYHVVVNNISYDNNDENAENTQDFFPDELRVLIKKYGQMNMNVIINEKQTHKNGLTKSNELYEDDYKKSEKEATHGYLYPSLSQSQSKTEHATTHDKYLLTAPPQKILVSARYQKNHVEENFLTFHFEHNARPKSVFRRLCFTSNKSSVLIPFFIFERETSSTALPHSYESPLKALGRCLKKIKKKLCSK